MKGLKYQVYIKSPQWRQKCKEAYSVYGRKCRKCLSTKSLHMHHRTYKHLYRERLEDLVPLCKRCHKALHFDKRFARLRVEEATDYFLTGKFKVKKKRVKRVPEKVLNQRIREAKTRPLVDHKKFKEMYGIEYQGVQ